MPCLAISSAASSSGLLRGELMQAVEKMWPVGRLMPVACAYSNTSFPLLKGRLHLAPLLNMHGEAVAVTAV